MTWRSRGYLPHIDAGNLVQHLIFRLGDSLPTAILKEVARARPVDRAVTVDRAVDDGCGRCDLAIPIIGELIQTALLAFDGERYALTAWCVMPNHVHALLEIKPGYPVDRVMHSWKSYTAKEANRLSGRNGPFWAREYFDKFMRDEEQLARTAAYIEGNPVKAGLCENVKNWRFSSAWQGWGRRDAGGPDKRW